MNEKMNFETAYFASGSFWGAQYHFDKAEGVISTYTGYMGGAVENPTYEQVKEGNTGHVETVMVLFDPAEISYSRLIRLYFETHDFTQANGQGPDLGNQYRSVIFYHEMMQQIQAEEMLEILLTMGYMVTTMIKPASIFWIAEDHHQNYYDKSGGTPYCHIHRKIFD